MSSRSKKSKHRSKLSDDLSQIKYDKTILANNENEHDNDAHENHHKKANSITRKRKRNHTKISHNKINHNKINNLSNIIIDTKEEKGRKVKFSKIDVIDVESWKKLNLKMTAEENVTELLKLTEGRKQRKKNVSCCIII